MVYCIEELSSFEVFDLVTLLVMLLSCCCEQYFQFDKWFSKVSKIYDPRYKLRNLGEGRSDRKPLRSDF
jgi:hypothetical protein